MKKTKRVLAILIGLLLISLSTSALAEEVTLNLDDGHITIEMQADGTYKINRQTTPYDSDTSFTVTQNNSNTATGNTITIKAAAGQTAKVTLSGVNIDVSTSAKAAVSTDGGGDVIIELKGKNTVKSGQYHAGIEKGNARKLTIADDGNDGSLEATGGNSGAGIGGGLMNGSGSGITISGGEVNATGGRGGAGIGGGHKGSGNNIAFSGKVKATVQGGVGDHQYYGAGAGIGNGGSFSNGNPVNGTDLHLDSGLLNVSGLEAGAIIRCYKQDTGIPDSLLYEIPELPDGEVVNVQCTTNSDHAKKTYQLIAGSYDFGEVQGDTCEITVKPEKYVDQYNLDIGVNHTLVDSDQTGTIHLKYDKEAQKWQLANPSGVPVVFNVKCDNTQPPLDTITIEVSKVWDDDSNKPDQITVLLLANGKEVDRDTIRPDNEDTWFHRFNDMPKNDSNGNLINYTVKEENVPAGWTPYYWTADKLIFRIHNVPTENTREIKVTKTVSGDGADKAKYFDFKVTLLQDLDGNGEIGDGTHPLSDTYTFGGVTFTNGEATFKLKHGESFTITGIPSHVQYLPLQYKVEEIAPSGYTVKVNGSADSSISGAFTDAKTVEINFENIKESGTNPTPSPSTDPSPTPTPTPGGGNGGGHSHYYPTTTPVPVIVIPPKTGDMTIWQSILHFLGIR